MSPLRFAGSICLLLIAQAVTAQEPQRADPLAGKEVLLTNPEVPVFVPKDGKWVEIGKAPRPIGMVRQATETAYRVYFGEIEGWVRKAEVVLLDDATAYFTERIQRDPKDAFAYRQRGVARSERRNTDYDGGLADLNEAVRLQPTDPFAWRHRGMVRAFKLEYDKAIADINESIRLDPNSAEGYNKRANIWGRQQMPDKALADLEEAIRREPHNGDNYTQRGCAWFAKGDRARGWADLDKAVALNPEIGWFYVMRANMHEGFGELTEAVAELDRAIAVEPNVASWYFERCHAHLFRVDYPSALADIDRALKLDPTNPLYYMKKMELFARRRMWDEAIAVLTEGIRLCPPNKGLLYGNRANCDLMKKDYRAALADFESGLREDPNNVMGQLAHAELLATCPDKSMRDLNRAIAEMAHMAEQDGGKDVAAINRVAFYCTLAGRTEEAERWSAKAKALKPPPVIDPNLPPLPPAKP